MAYYIFFLLTFFSCSHTNKAVVLEPQIEKVAFKYLALGDSYTIGESVCETCRFPEQLKDSLNRNEEISGLTVEIIAKTGWTTTNLINAISEAKPSNDFDLVTLLIGVNNQYQNKPFSIYEDEFPKLLSSAIAFANGEKNKVIVVSIPDYAYTSFGKSSSNPQQISDEIDQYNAYAKRICEEFGVYFQEITDITRLGLKDPDLVAKDGLHPSQKAYKKFVERIYNNAFKAIKD